MDKRNFDSLRHLTNPPRYFNKPCLLSLMENSAMHLTMLLFFGLFQTRHNFSTVVEGGLSHRSSEPKPYLTPEQVQRRIRRECMRNKDGGCVDNRSLRNADSIELFVNSDHLCTPGLFLITHIGNVFVHRRGHRINCIGNTGNFLDDRCIRVRIYKWWCVC